MYQNGLLWGIIFQNNDGIQIKKYGIKHRVIENSLNDSSFSVTRIL